MRPAFVSASAVGYYGSAPGALLTEDSPRGETFLADVCGEWESAALAAPGITRGWRCCAPRRSCTRRAC